ncbi:ferritin-like domain-containing protein [Lentzea sp. BCCO 10_0798]|uniref:Ferritin-like domain-containing protein n=1 Tax=Lentzea kristufekii TaxID=3095430 RepID=A0ABU4TRT6_9PSEU|nr:ferritin-like domain-containing protein [Lentzea sp. BCCO 10_0798]MDX8050927.1 ferritin-like domain-containing protein [Lentzea sp. BCCO 10_0798]
MHSYEVFTQYERNHWQLKDIDFTRVRRDLVRPEHVTMAKSGVMGESNVIAAVHGFLNEFVDDYDFSTFAVVWGYQEVQHHYAFKTWLDAVGEHVDDAPVEAMREPYAPGTTPSATLATNIISELTVNHVYRRVAAAVDEPVLKDILLRASRDEAGHAREFIHYCRGRLAKRPDEIPSVLETLYVYTSDAKIKHPVSMFKSSLTELDDHETIDTGFELFLEQVADEGELQELQTKIRRVFGQLVDQDLTTNGRVRRALAEALA